MSTVNIGIVENGLEHELNVLRRSIFALMDSEDHQDFSNKVIASHHSGNNVAAEVQDKILASEQYHDLINSEQWGHLAKEFMDGEAEDFQVVFPFFRVDLPDSFKADALKLNLPWHQEAAYYLPKGNCSVDSIVISTPLHDCSKEQGALVASTDDVETLEEHRSVFMDKANQRHHRVICSPPKAFTVLETRFGESQVIRFLTKHRSGINTSDLVRLTLLVRISQKQDKEVI